MITSSAFELLRRSWGVGQIQNLPIVAHLAGPLVQKPFNSVAPRGRFESDAALAQRHVADHPCAGNGEDIGVAWLHEKRVELEQRVVSDEESVG